MGQLTQTTAQLQVILDDADDANVGKTSLTDGSDTTAVAFKKSGFYSLQGSSANAPSTDRAVLISAVRNTAATGEIRYGQIAITESNGLWWNRDDGGSLGTWYEAVTTASAQTLTNKTLTSPVLTTPQMNDSAADHQYIFAGSNLAADRTVTLPLLTGDDTFVFAAHTQTLTNKTLTTPTVSGLTLSDASIIFEGATANDHETTLTVTDPTADRTITLPDATDTLVGRATTDTLTNKTLTSPVASGLTLSDASIVFEGATANAHETTLTVTDPTADRTITLPDATDTLVGLATTDTLTNKTLTSPVFNTGVSGTAVLDADDFDGASATTLASSESIKAYVDAQVGSFDTLSEVLAAGNTTGSTNIEVENAQKVQFRDSAIYINSSADGQLDLVADTEIQIAATTVDLNGNLDVSGTASATNVSLPDDGVLSLGTSDELTLKHHNSGYSHLINTTGTLYIDSDSVTFRDDDGSPSNMVVSQTGVDVTGTVTADGLTVDGDAIIKSGGVNNTPADLSLWHTDVSIVSGDDLAVISAEGSDSGGSAPYQGAKILFDAAANWDTGSSNYYPTNIKFFTQDNSGTDTIAAGPRMIISSSGSVGIGATSPSGPLHVQTSHTETDVTAANTNSTVIIGNSAAGNGVYNSIKFSANQQDMYIMSFNNSTQADRRMGFFLGSVAGDAASDERLSILGNGSVGIGTTTPSNKLDIKGTVGFEATNSTNKWLAYHYTDNTLRFNYNGAGADELVIDSSGNVGIGTDGPDSLLHLKKTSADVKLTLETGESHDCYINFSGATSEAAIGYDATDNALLFCNPAGDLTTGEAMRITSAGALQLSDVNSPNDINTAIYSNSDVLEFEAFGTNGAIAFSTGSGVTEAARFDSSQNFLLGGTSVTSPSGAAGPLFLLEGSNPELIFRDDTGTANNMSMYYINDQLVWYSGSAENLRLTNSGNLTVAGALSKGSGSFRIDHPLPTKTSTHHLVHSFVEGPQADLIYRGKVTLVGGSATVNVDTAAGMTDGTFEVLCADVQCFTSNESGWTAVKGSVSGNTLNITAQDNTCTDTISWMVVGERQDQHMLDTEWTDENGKVIVEPLKES